jgi:hypothetical protein
MQENQNTIAKSVKRIFEGATVRWTPGSGIGSYVVECDRNPDSESCLKSLQTACSNNDAEACRRIMERECYMNPNSQACNDAMMTVNNVKNKGKFLTVQSSQDAIPIEKYDVKLFSSGPVSPFNRAMKTLVSAGGQYNTTTKKFEEQKGDNIVADDELVKLGVDVNKIRDALSVLANKEQQSKLDYNKIEQEISDFNQRSIKKQELQIRYITDPEIIKAVDELANQFVNLNIVKLYEKQPYWNEFCTSMKPSDEQVQKLKRDLTMVEAIINSYGKTANKVLTNIIEKIDNIMTNCKVLDPEIMSRLRKVHKDIKSIVAGYLTASEIQELCKPSVTQSVTQQQTNCKTASDLKDKENKDLHKRHMMFIILLIILLIFVIVYFTVLKK